MVTMALSIIQGAQSIPSNTTNITLKAVVTSTGGSYNHNSNQTTGTYVVRNHGHSSPAIKSGSFAKTFDANTKTEILSVTFACPHNADGTLSLDCTVVYNTGVSAGTLTGTINNYGISTIPRLSKINTVTNPLTLGNTLRITIIRNSNTFKHKVRVYSVDGTYDYTTPDFFTGTSIDITNAHITSAWAGTAPNAKSFSATVRLYTFTSTGDFIGAVDKTITCNIPNSAAPSVITPQYTIIDGFSKDGTVYALQGISRLKINNVPQVNLKYAASLRTLTMNGKNISSASFPYTSSLLFNGANDFTFTATDSRGYTSPAAAVSVSAYPYRAPQIKNISFFRCDEDGLKNDIGEYYSISAESAIAPVKVNNVNKNSVVQFTYKIRRVGEEYGDPIDLTSGVADVEPLPGSGDVKLYSYEAQVDIVDEVGKETFVTAILATSKIAFNLKDGGNGAAFGKYAEIENCLEVAYNLKVLGKFYSEELFDLPDHPVQFASDNFERYVGGIRYYPALGMVICDLSVKVLQNDLSNTFVNVLSFQSAYSPRATVPLLSMKRAEGSGVSDDVFTYAGVESGNGFIRVKTVLPHDSSGGSRIYLNGFWFVQ